MRTSFVAVAAAVVVGLTAAPAAAQTGPGPIGSRLDLSINVISLTNNTLELDIPGTAAGAVVTFHFSPRHGLQFVTDVAEWRDGTRLNRMVAYGGEYRQTFLTQSPRLRFFWTAGVLGYFERTTRDRQPTIVINGVPIVFPPRTTTTFIPPIIPKGSLGVEYFFSERIGVRGEAGFVGLPGLGSFRAGIGVVVAAGKRAAR